jgi:hypothetical protein
MAMAGTFELGRAVNRFCDPAILTKQGRKSGALNFKSLDESEKNQTIHQLKRMAAT